MIINNNLTSIGKTSQASPVKLDKESEQKQSTQIEQQTSHNTAKGVDISLSENITTAFEKISEHANSVNMSRVEELRQQIANGNLTMDVDKISENIINTELS